MKLDWKTCLRVGVTLFLLYLAIHYWGTFSKLLGLMLGAAMPLFIGAAIAYVVNIIMSFLEKFYLPRSKNKSINASRRPVCLALAFACMVGAVVLIVRLIVPQLWSCMEIIIDEVPGVLQKGVEIISRWHMLPDNIIQSLVSIDWQSLISRIVQAVTSGLGNVMEMVISTITSVVSLVVTALLSIIFSVYVLISKEKLARQFRLVCNRYMKTKWVNKLYYILEVADKSFHSFFVGQFTEALILGLMCTLGMMVLQMPYTTMVGALIAFTALIPIAGAYIGAGVGAFMILTVSPMQALIFLGFILILQQLEGNLIYPKVVGTSIGLPGIWVLAAVTVGGGVMGIPGMLLGVPLTATIYKLIRNDVHEGKPNGIVETI